MKTIVYMLYRFAQLYGDMVIDEVSLGVLSNYNKVTIDNKTII